MADPGDGARPPPQQSLARDAHEAWAQFLDYALRQRLDPDRFADFAPALHARHPMAAAPLADLCLRPCAWNRYTLDPRMPLYLQTLLDLRLVDLQSVLAGLFRYSTAHTVVGKTDKGKGVKSEAGGGGGGGEDEEESKAGIKGNSDAVVRWLSSFASDEVIFYRLTKAVGSGSAVRNSRDAVEVCVMMARWMALFTAASAALPPAHDEDPLMGGMDGAVAGSASKKSRDDLENSRAAFVMLLLGVCENPVVLQALSKPLAKGRSRPRGERTMQLTEPCTDSGPVARKALSQSLANFVPSIVQGAPPIATKLELFRTETLAAFDPVDKKKEAADAEMDELLDETLGLQNIVLPHVDIARSRAGLYVYLNAAVSSH